MKKLAAMANRKGGNKNALEVVVNEAFDNALHSLSEAVQRPKDLLVSEQHAFVENYENGNLWVILKLKFRAGLLQANESNAAIGIEFAETEIAADRLCSVLKRSRNRTEIRCTDGGQHHAVFIGDISLNEFPKELVLPSRIHVQSLENVGRFLLESKAYHSITYGLVTVSATGMGKVQIFVGDSALRKEKFPHHMVESRCEIMNSISDDCWKKLGERFGQANDQIFTPIRIFLDDEFVWIEVDKPLNEAVSVIDVLLGPLDF